MVPSVSEAVAFTLMFAGAVKLALFVGDVIVTDGSALVPVQFPSERHASLQAHHTPGSYAPPIEHHPGTLQLYFLLTFTTLAPAA